MSYWGVAPGQEADYLNAGDDRVPRPLNDEWCETREATCADGTPGIFMDKLAQITTFVRVVERGGFSAAARDLQVAPSVVTTHIQALEQRLGVRLLNRSSPPKSARPTMSDAWTC